METPKKKETKKESAKDFELPFLGQGKTSLGCFLEGGKGGRRMCWDSRRRTRKERKKHVQQRCRNNKTETKKKSCVACMCARTDAERPQLLARMHVGACVWGTVVASSRRKKMEMEKRSEAVLAFAKKSFFFFLFSTRCAPCVGEVQRLVHVTE